MTLFTIQYHVVCEQQYIQSALLIFRHMGPLTTCANCVFCWSSRGPCRSQCPRCTLDINDTVDEHSYKPVLDAEQCNRGPVGWWVARGMRHNDIP